MEHWAKQTMAPRKKTFSTRRTTAKTKKTKKKATFLTKAPPRSTAPVTKTERIPATTPETAPPRDKYEISPTSQAKCHVCKRKIIKGSRRLGIEQSSPRFGIYHKYYHDECVAASVKKNLRLGGCTPQQLISQQLQESNQSKMILRQRATLRENLRLLRSLFAHRLNYAAFCICKDETLDELVVKMPHTKTEFLAIRGMGPKKFQSFGGPFMQVIKDYQASTDYKKTSKQWASSKKPSAEIAEVIDLVGEPSEPTRRKQIQAPVRTVDDDDDEIVIQIAMTMEQIVEEKFKHAQENGYVIAVDI